MKTIKNLFGASIVACLLASCASQPAYYYQISQAKPVDESIVKSNNDDNGYYYQDQNCRISYNFWAEKGAGGFTVTNLTDEVLFILKDKCFFVLNGGSNEYFHNKDVVETISGKTTHTPELKVVGIAPHASKSFQEYCIYSDVYLNCDLDRKPAANDPAMISFSLENSPVRFGNFVTYKVGENGKEIGVSNMFFIHRITNYRKTDLFTTEKRESCPNVSDLREYNQTLMRFAPTTGYYIEYVK